VAVAEPVVDSNNLSLHVILAAAVVAVQANPLSSSPLLGKTKSADTLLYLTEVRRHEHDVTFILYLFFMFTLYILLSPPVRRRPTALAALTIDFASRD
jgi:hypothetical protein